MGILHYGVRSNCEPLIFEPYKGTISIEGVGSGAVVNAKPTIIRCRAQGSRGCSQKKATAKALFSVVFEEAPIVIRRTYNPHSWVRSRASFSSIGYIGIIRGYRGVYASIIMTAGKDAIMCCRVVVKSRAPQGRIMSALYQYSIRNECFSTDASNFIVKRSGCRASTITTILALFL